MNFFIVSVNDILPDILQKSYQGSSNNSFRDYLLNYIFENGKPKSNVGHTGDYKQKILRNKFIGMDDLVPYFIDEGAKMFLKIDCNLAKFLLRLMLHDNVDGLTIGPGKLSLCKIEQFMHRCLKKYADPADITMCSLNLSYYSRQNFGFKLDDLKENVEHSLKEKTSSLMHEILRYPENCSAKQLDEMYTKIQIFIITNYFIGCPSDTELLKRTRQSIDSVLARGDIQKYVLKKKYHRHEYLHRLGATVCGIMVYNMYNGTEGDKTNNAINVNGDLEMALLNTNESLGESLKMAAANIETAVHILEEAVLINIKEKTVTYRQPLKVLRQINKFVIVFSIYKRDLERINEMVHKIQYWIDVAKKKFHCVTEKINDILKFRSAIETEFIFPHFVNLSEVWTSLIIYLNCLMEVNKIKDHLDGIVNENVQKHYHSLIRSISQTTSTSKTRFEETLIGQLNIDDTKQSMDYTKLGLFLKDYCFLTIVVTKGLLVPSRIEWKSNQHLNTIFGLANTDFLRYAENNKKRILQEFNNMILRSVDMILFLQLEDVIVKLGLNSSEDVTTKQKNCFAQTELHQKEWKPKNNNLSNVSWNVWDHHRRTIELANQRQKQTTSAQTDTSFGKRNCHIQCYTAQSS